MAEIVRIVAEWGATQWRRACGCDDRIASTAPPILGPTLPAGQRSGRWRCRRLSRVMGEYRCERGELVAFEGNQSNELVSAS